jgi:hypothetical protein
LDHAVTLTRNLADLLTFVSQKQAGVSRAEFCTTIDDPLRGKHVEVLHSNFVVTENSSDTKPFEMMFNLCDHKDRAADIWDAWGRLEEEYRPMLHSYLGILVQRSPYAFHRILDLSRAAEAYYRRKYGGKGKKLWQLLYGLSETQPPGVKGLLGDPQVFSRDCAHARNYYAHYDREYAGGHS